jgi:hypothetical protein
MAAWEAHPFQRLKFIGTKGALVGVSSSPTCAFPDGSQAEGVNQTDWVPIRIRKGVQPAAKPRADKTAQIRIVKPRVL